MGAGVPDEVVVVVVPPDVAGLALGLGADPDSVLVRAPEEGRGRRLRPWSPIPA